MKKKKQNDEAPLPAREAALRILERTGISAVIIEDKQGLKKNSLFGTGAGQKQASIPDFCEKITAGKNAQKTKDFMIIARCESLILEQGLDDALTRCHAYVKAGADGIMIHSKAKTPDEVFAFCDAFRKDDLHLASKVGVVPSLLFAFVLTGWIGMASKTRMQFYRYKNQEYILAARTLGAKDSRLMFKHIFPNAIGTLITSAVLTIPSVIYSESNMTYLGIVNLDSSNMTSLGTMLSQGTSMLTTYPHIILFPAIYISLLMISFNLFGNGLRDAFNPSLRGTEE